MSARRKEPAARRQTATPTGNYRPLSSRQKEIAGYLRDGRTPKEIAGLLHISPESISRHTLMLRVKTGSRTLYQALCRIQEATPA